MRRKGRRGQVCAEALQCLVSEVGIDHVGRSMLEDVAGQLAADGQSVVGRHKTDQILAQSDCASKKILDQRVNLRAFLGYAIEQVDEEKLLKVTAIKSAGKAVKNRATRILAHVVSARVDKILGCR